MYYQLSLFTPYVELEGKPEKCPRCGAELRLSHYAFTLTSGHRGFYEVCCAQCPANYRLYRNPEGEPDWELLSPSEDPTWCVTQDW